MQKLVWLNIVSGRYSFLGVSQLFSQAKLQEADIVIYGGTSAAITAAVQSKKRMGRSVVIVSPDERLGGMSSNGLCWTDNEMGEVIGIAREFYHRIWRVLPNSRCLEVAKF